MSHLQATYWPRLTTINIGLSNERSNEVLDIILGKVHKQLTKQFVEHLFSALPFNPNHLNVASSNYLSKIYINKKSENIDRSISDL